LTRSHQRCEPRLEAVENLAELGGPKKALPQATEATYSMSRELNGEINADNTFKEWTVTNLLSSPAVAETHPKIHVKLAPHLRKVS